MTRSALADELNFIMKSLAERRTQVSLTSTWTVGVRWVDVVLEFLNAILVKIWKRKHHFRNRIKSRPGRHRHNTLKSTHQGYRLTLFYSKIVNTLVQHVSMLVNSSDLSLPFL